MWIEYYSFREILIKDQCLRCILLTPASDIHIQGVFQSLACIPRYPWGAGDLAALVRWKVNDMKRDHDPDNDPTLPTPSTRSEDKCWNPLSYHSHQNTALTSHYVSGASSKCKPLNLSSYRLPFWWLLRSWDGEMETPPSSMCIPVYLLFITAWMNFLLCCFCYNFLKVKIRSVLN